MTTKKRKMPVRTGKVSLEGTYEGWECVVRLNPPLRVFGDFSSGEFDRIISGLRLVILNWNFVDEDGNDLGPPDDTNVSLLPLDLAQAVAEAFTAKIAELDPN